MTGKANLEVRPTFVNKGEIAKRLVAEYGDEAGEAPEFVYCLGDDSTDEGKFFFLLFALVYVQGLKKKVLIVVELADMFRALRNTTLPKADVFSVTVGASSKQTLATWHLLEPSDVIASIALLNGANDAENVGPVVAVVDGKVPEARL